LSRINYTTDSQLQFYNRVKECFTPLISLSWLDYAIGQNANFQTILDRFECNTLRTLIDENNNSLALPEELQGCPNQNSANFFINLLNQQPPIITPTDLVNLYTYPIGLRCRLVERIVYKGIPVNGIPPYYQPQNETVNVSPSNNLSLVPVEITPVVVIPTITATPDSEVLLTPDAPLGIFAGSEALLWPNVPLDVLLGAEAVFTARSEDNLSTDIYILKNGIREQAAYWRNTPEDELNPVFQGDDFAYYSRQDDGLIFLVHQTFYDAPSRYYAPQGYRFDIESRMIWQPDSYFLWVTLVDERTGQYRLVRYNFENSASPYSSQTPNISDARNPTIVGPYLVYERIVGGRRIIYQQVYTNISLNGGISISESISGSCQAPAFWEASEVIFVCNKSIYRFRVNNPIQINSFEVTQLNNIQNLARLQASYYISLDDGSEIFLLDFRNPISIFSFNQYTGTDANSLGWVR
jgi:hypothetical protein